MKQVLAILFLVFSGGFPALLAQDGHPFIINYSLYAVVDKHQNAIEQGPDNLMFFANPKGVITFDGDEWGFISLERHVLAMVYDSITDQLYTGCEEDFGYLKKDLQGNFIFHSLAGSSSGIGNIKQVKLSSDAVYFAGNRSVTEISRFGNKFKHQWVSEPTTQFSGICNVGKKTFLNITGKGLVELVEDKMITVPTILSGNDELSFSLPFDARRTLLGMGRNSIYLFDGKRVLPYAIVDSAYLQASILTNGVSLSSQQMALGTLMGGVMVIDKSSGKTLYTLNYNTGLPDDEVYKLGKDNSSGLWISNSFGLSRVDLRLPVKSFSHYQGLKGNITSVLNWVGSVYVGTSEGVYVLHEVKEYSSREIKVKVNTSPVKSTSKSSAHPESRTSLKENKSVNTREAASSETTKSSENNKTEKEVDAKPKESKGFFARIFSSSSKNKEEPVLETKDEEIKKQQVKFRKEKIYTLQSVSHQYEKIAGIDEKCKQLVGTDDRILAATNNGLFEIKDGKGIPVLKEKYILFISKSIVPERFFIGTTEGLFSIVHSEGNWKIENHYTELSQIVYSAVETKPNELWLGAENSLYHVTTDVMGVIKNINSFSIDSRYAEQVHVKNINQKLFLFLSSGIYTYNKDSLTPVTSASTDFFSVPIYIFSDGPEAWILQNGSWKSMADSGYYNPSMDIFLNLFQEIQYISYDQEGNLWIVDNSNQLAKVDRAEVKLFEPDFRLFVRSIRSNNELVPNISSININYQQGTLDFKIIAPYFLKPNSTQYQYKLDGLEEAWSGWSNNSVISFPVLPSGKYTLNVRARNIFGNITSEKSVNFYVKPPWWQSYWFMGLCAAVMALLVWLFIRLRTRKLMQDKLMLEQKVKERTFEIEKQKDEIQHQNIELNERNEEILQQKEEIEAQRDEIETQKNEMEAQRDRIALQNKEITDSIHYAKRIQTAVLPSDMYLHQLLPESFVFFKPRDIVSGDFYWMTSRKGKTIITVADCTGHGVPGAFMSMLGVSLLNEIVTGEGITTPSEILFKLREMVKVTLSRGGHEHETKDGMDIALCTLDPGTSTLEFAGAFNSLYLIRDNVLTEYKADKMPIGIFEDLTTSFTNHNLRYQSGDVVYIFSDGYMDQFGGPEGRKLMSKNFKNLLTSIHHQPMQKQKELLDSYMKEWSGDNVQVDDMLIIGMRI